MLSAILFQSILFVAQPNPVRSIACDNEDGYHVYVGIDAVSESDAKLSQVYFRKDGALVAQFKATSLYEQVAAEEPYHSWEFADVANEYHLVSFSTDLKEGVAQISGGTIGDDPIEFTCTFKVIP